MKPPSNHFNRGLPKGKAKDSKNIVLYPPSQKTPTLTTSFEFLSESKLSSPSLPPIQSTDVTIGFDIASPRIDQVLEEQSLRDTGNENKIPTEGSNGMFKKVAFISPLPRPTTPTDKATTIRPPSSHPVKLGYNSGVSIDHSLRSYSSFLLPAACWSEGAGEDLVTHLVPRERNRQEVMWEIVTSEVRYVAELLKMKETFINPLLHPYVNSSSSEVLEHNDMSLLSSPAAGSGDSKNNNGRAETTSHASRQGGFVSISRSHQSLRLPPPTYHNDVSTASLGHSSFVELSPTIKDQDQGRKSTYIDSSVPGMQRKSKESFRKNASGGVTPHQLPDDLRLCLEGIEGILTEHLKLVRALRKRCDEQYPLVRSLDDIFMDNSHTLRGYTDYVLHLERALEQASDAISTNTSTKRPKSEWLKFCALVQKLEIDARDRGETGLAISLSKPFRRLFKYSAPFKAVLSLSDVCMHEYEGAIQLIAEVEGIIRSIEDAKDQKEEHDKTRDILARIKGLDKVMQFAVPKPSRVLVEERMLNLEESSDASKASLRPPAGITSTLRRKTSSKFKHLSDVLRNGGDGIGSQKDIWLVVFNDVVLRCQRTGITSLPLGAAHFSSATSTSGLQGKSKSATTGRRKSSARPRNLYKFIKIENWAIDNVNQSHSDGLDCNQDMTFSHWNTDNAILQQSMAESQLDPASRQTESPWPSLYPGSSLANARFGSRLVSVNSVFSGSCPPSRLTVTTPSLRSVMLDEGHSMRAAITRPGERGTITRRKKRIVSRPAWSEERGITSASRHARSGEKETVTTSVRSVARPVASASRHTPNGEKETVTTSVRSVARPVASASRHAPNGEKETVTTSVRSVARPVASASRHVPNGEKETVTTSIRVAKQVASASRHARSGEKETVTLMRRRRGSTRESALSTNLNVEHAAAREAGGTTTRASLAGNPSTSTARSLQLRSTLPNSARISSKTRTSQHQRIKSAAVALTPQ